MTTTKRRTISLVPTPSAEPAQQELAFGPPHRAGDELFPADEAAPTRPNDYTAISCASCAQAARVPVTYPARLCEACFSDLVITRQSLDAMSEAYNRRAVAVYDDWQAVKAATDPATLARWERAEQAGAEPPTAFAGSWAARTTLDTPIARLLCAWEAMQRECEAIERGHAQIADGRREVALADRVAAGETVERPPVGWRISAHSDRWLLRSPGGVATWHVSYEAAQAAAAGEVTL